MIDSNVNSYY